MTANIPNSNQNLVDLLREGISKEEVRKNYDKWAKQYDKDHVELDYRAYTLAANKASELFPTEARANAKVLDVGAGTGLLGSTLREAGFRNIDGVDPSNESFEVAREKGIYNKYIVEFFTENPLDIEQGTYDIVTGSGIIGYSLVPYQSIIEMVRLTKPGGFIILSIRKSALGYKELEGMIPLMEKLENEGKMKVISRETYQVYFKDSPGVLFVFQKH